MGGAARADSVMSVERRDGRAAGLPDEVPCVHPPLGGLISQLGSDPASESRPASPAGGPASPGLPPPSGPAGTSSVSKDRKSQMMARRRAMRMPRGFAFPDDGGSRAAR